MRIIYIFFFILLISNNLLGNQILESNEYELRFSSNNINLLNIPKKLKNDAGLRKWFERKSLENKNSKGDDIRIDTQDFLDVVSSAIQGIIQEDSEDPISRVRMMISRLLAVVVEEDEDLEEQWKSNALDRMRVLDGLRKPNPLPEECDLLHISDKRLDIHVLKEILFLCGGNAGGRFSGNEFQLLSTLSKALPRIWEATNM